VQLAVDFCNPVRKRENPGGFLECYPRREYPIVAPLRQSPCEAASENTSKRKRGTTSPAAEMSEHGLTALRDQGTTGQATRSTNGAWGRSRKLRGSSRHNRFRRNLVVARTPAKVGLPKRERLLSIVGGNVSCMPLKRPYRQARAPAELG